MYSTGTGGQATSCALTVSSLGGGFIAVATANSTALYVQPSTFQILLEGVDFSNDTDVEQVYDIATHTVFRAAPLPQYVFTGARTLLPTIGAVLALDFNVSYLFHIANGSRTETGSLASGGEALVTLLDGSALAVGGLIALHIIPIGRARFTRLPRAHGRWPGRSPRRAS